jgi:hypothetical protein
MLSLLKIEASSDDDDDDEDDVTKKNLVKAN